MIDEVVAAIRAGEPVVLPTDTVYGLCADAHSEQAVRRLYGLKGRKEVQATALVAADADAVVDAVPELRGQALLRGPYTLILPNPARRFSWLTGTRPETIGVRIPALAGDAAAVLRQVGVVAATSANRPGERDPRTVEEVPEEFRAASGAVLDAGPLPGTPSTVVDLTGAEPAVLREGAVAADEALERVRALVG
ncbi:MAG TPA: L-threonylcarbamoyladenylate synthase [Gaiellaceae bacterium]|nr:L-threonylcarbamoyladenylate synthase [Gaiellaceae bacterium]